MTDLKAQLAPLRGREAQDEATLARGGELELGARWSVGGRGDGMLVGLLERLTVLGSVLARVIKEIGVCRWLMLEFPRQG